MIKSKLLQNYDVIVVGAGQAGLAIGYYLSQSSLSFLILDKNERVGDSWRQRYDSLELFTPRHYCSLRGLEMNGDPEGFPNKEEMADYLEQYSLKFRLHIQNNEIVHSVNKESSKFRIETNKGLYSAKNVIIATGTFHKPYIPTFSKEIPTYVLQLHTSQYKNHNQLSEGNVLVVGAGNSGAQIAVELANSYKVTLATNPKKLRFIKNILGKDISWWGDKLKLYNISGKGLLSKYLCRAIRSGQQPIRGYKLKHLLEEGKITLKPRVEGTDCEKIIFEDGAVAQYNNIIWATGFRPDYSWIKISNITDDQGYPLQKKGVSNVEGLYFLGILCEPSILSGSINFISNDAEAIYNKLSIA